jgi:hypothetical protein
VDNRRTASARRQSEPENEEYQMTDQPGENPTEPTPEGSATPPPAPPPASPTPPPATPAGAPAGSSYQFDADKAKAAFQGAHKFDLGIIGLGVVAWLAGFMPFYTASVGAAGFHVSANASAYHGFFGWFGVWCCLAAAVVATLVLLGVSLPFPAPLAVLGAFALGTICLILALFIFPGGGCGGVPGCDTGHGFGYWLALICGLGGTALAFLRYQEKTAAA